MPRCRRRNKKLMVNFAALVARTGKEQGTQIAQDEVDSGTAVKLGQTPIQQPDFDYGTMKLLSNIYNSMDQLKLAQNINDGLIVAILSDLGQVFLHPDSKTALMTGQGGKLPAPARIENCDLRELRGRLETLLNDPNIAKDEAKVTAIKTVLNALDEQILIQLIQLADIYQALGKDIEIPEEKVINLIENLSKDGICSPDEVQAILKNFVGGNNQALRPALIAHTMGPEIVVRQDGRIATKRSMMFSVETQNEIERMEVVAYGDTGLVVLVPRGAVVPPPPPGTEAAGIRGGFGVNPEKYTQERFKELRWIKELPKLNKPQLQKLMDKLRSAQSSPNDHHDETNGTGSGHITTDSCQIADEPGEQKTALPKSLYELVMKHALQGKIQTFNEEGFTSTPAIRDTPNSLALQAVQILNRAENGKRSLSDMELKFMKSVVELNIDIPLKQLQKTLNVGLLAGMVTEKTRSAIMGTLTKRAHEEKFVKLYDVRKIFKDSRNL
uniref:Uncharacterized protein n=1 Tax=Trichuris muris TaxID=70415 RepID=A0A5S6Q301_TRIMR